jgi:hypothetical protein
VYNWRNYNSRQNRLKVFGISPQELSGAIKAAKALAAAEKQGAIMPLLFKEHGNL